MSSSPAPAWGALIGQARVREALTRAVTTGRVAHAYLFHGPDGTGKRAAALALAQRLQGPAGASKVERLIHPDVHLLFPTPSDADARDVAARLQRLAANPYAAIDYVRRPSLEDPTKASNKQALYRVEQINDEVRRTMSLRPLEGRYKITILTDADALRVEAANALLKLLEEPSAQSLFVLTTSRPDRLLPTILSRCQRLRFDVLPAETLEATLIDRDGLTPDRAALFARMADGSYTRALDFLENEDLLAHRQLVIDFMRHAYTQHTAKLAELVEQFGRLSREQVKGVFQLMLRWMRDLVLIQTLGPNAPIVNIDQQVTLVRFCGNLPQADLDALILRTEEALELAARNVQIPLLFIVLAHQLRRAMEGAPTDSLYVPLAHPAPTTA
ncbi:MAG: AAA family ATPase [Bacteroidota bacterium]